MTLPNDSAKELVERLRKQSVCVFLLAPANAGASDVSDGLREAASLIERQAREIEDLRNEMAALRELAAHPLAIQKVRDVFGPLSLWSKSGFEAEVKRRIDAALKREGEK